MGSRQPSPSRHKATLSRQDPRWPSLIPSLTFDVKIYEAANSHDIQGGGINIFPNSLSALRTLGLNLDSIRATRVEKVCTARRPSRECR